MASTAKWITNLRQSIKNTCGTGWSVRGRESKGELITQVTFRYPDNQGRTAANVNLAWNAKNTTKIITAIEQLNDLMTTIGSDITEAVKHYISFGHSQGKLTNSFDAQSYLNNYADLKNAFGNDQELATKHYVEYGFNEGRVF